MIEENGDKYREWKRNRTCLKCLEEYHRTSTNIHVTNVMSAEVNPATDLVLQRFGNEKIDLGYILEFTNEWLKNEAIRALFSLSTIYKRKSNGRFCYVTHDHMRILSFLLLFNRASLFSNLLRQLEEEYFNNTYGRKEEKRKAKRPSMR